MTEKLTKKDIEENLKAIEKGKPLTKSLCLLNGEFKREYNLRTGADVPMISSSPYPAEIHTHGIKYERTCAMCGKRFKTSQKGQIYCTKNCRKIHSAQLDRDPERMRRRRENKKEYDQKLENKEKLKEWQKKYYQKHRKEINAYQRKRTTKWKKQGLCIVCGKEREDKNFLQCEICREKARIARRKSYGRNKRT